MNNKLVKYKAWCKPEQKFYEDIDLSVILFETLSKYEEEDWVFCQYIGREDKHGKGIYVGDVVEIQRHGDENNTYIAVIEDIRNIPRELGGSSFDWCEVVGNIVENPNIKKELYGRG